MPELGRLIVWCELGVTRLLGELIGKRDPGSLIPVSVRRLLGDPNREALMPNLEAYLEHGGDVAAATSQLYVPRSSVYNRLRRIEELANVNLRSGGDRLDLHLGTGLWRTTGRRRGVASRIPTTVEPRYSSPPRHDS